MNQMRPLPLSLPLPTRPPRTSDVDWRTGLPSLTGRRVQLRELELEDAPALLAAVSPAEVARFITPQPNTVSSVERFIRWARNERDGGRAACFALTPRESDEVAGMFQVRALDASFDTAEWGFVIGSAHWGQGMFTDAATLLIDFAIDSIGVRRLEARAAAANGRGNGALRKIGAVQEGVLRRSFMREGRLHDQVLWSILADEWREAKALWSPHVSVH
jgi:[ribosomal protein S5]-alanine N-acetyltransferase